MIKIYGMNTCPDCIAVDKQVEGDNRYEIIDIGSHVKYLKEFLRLRDNNSVFDEARKHGYAGIPCFVLEDGTVTLSPEEAGIQMDEARPAASCRLDGTGCGPSAISCPQAASLPMDRNGRLMSAVSSPYAHAPFFADSKWHSAYAPDWY